MNKVIGWVAGILATVIGSCLVRGRRLRFTSNLHLNQLAQAPHRAERIGLLVVPTTK